MVYFRLNFNEEQRRIFYEFLVKIEEDGLKLETALIKALKLYLEKEKPY